MPSRSSKKLRVFFQLGTSFAALGGIYLACVTSHVLVRAKNYCLPYYDLGIYTEGALRWSFKNPNPMLSARGVRLFCDHFDPVIVLMSPFVHVFGLVFGAIVYEATAILLCLAPLIWLVVAEAVSLSGALLLGVLLLFHPGAVDAANFPVHPTTWAMTPWVWMVSALYLRRFKTVLAAFVLLLCCKEEFPFVAFILVPILWQQGTPRVAVAAASLSVVWLGFVFFLRPMWLGPVEHYAAVPFLGLMTEPLAYIRARLLQPGLLRRLPLFLLPLVPMQVWLAKTGRPRPSLASFLLGAPTMLLRILTQQWHHHYHAVSAAALTMPYLHALRRTPVPKAVFTLTCLMLLAVNEKTVGNTMRLYVPALRQGRGPLCPNDPRRLASIEAGFKLVELEHGKKILCGTNLLTRRVDLPSTFTLPVSQANFQGPFDVVFFEHPPFGTAWPISNESLQDKISCWRAQTGTKVLIDDGHVFLAEGRFSPLPGAAVP